MNEDNARLETETDTDPGAEADASGAAARPSRVPWPPILLVASVGAALVAGRVHPLPWPGLDDLPARVIGWGFGIAGVALIAWAAVTLAKARTTILPHRRVDRLVTNGPFRFRRNPIYLGEVFIMLGLAEATKNVWFVAAALAFALLVTWLAILPEERHLEARFGEDWRRYKETTRRWI